MAPSSSSSSAATSLPCLDFVWEGTSRTLPPLSILLVSARLYLSIFALEVPSPALEAARLRGPVSASTVSSIAAADAALVVMQLLTGALSLVASSRYALIPRLRGATFVVTLLAAVGTLAFHAFLDLPAIASVLTHPFASPLDATVAGASLPPTVVFFVVETLIALVLFQRVWANTLAACAPQSGACCGAGAPVNALAPPPSPTAHLWTAYYTSLYPRPALWTLHWSVWTPRETASIIWLGGVRGVCTSISSLACALPMRHMYASLLALTFIVVGTAYVLPFATAFSALVDEFDGADKQSLLWFLIVIGVAPVLRAAQSGCILIASCVSLACIVSTCIAAARDHISCMTLFALESARGETGGASGVPSSSPWMVFSCSDATWVGASKLAPSGGAPGLVREWGDAGARPLAGASSSWAAPRAGSLVAASGKFVSAAESHAVVTEAVAASASFAGMDAAPPRGSLVALPPFLARGGAPYGLCALDVSAGRTMLDAAVPTLVPDVGSVGSSDELRLVAAFDYALAFATTQLFAWLVFSIVLSLAGGVFFAVIALNELTPNLIRDLETQLAILIAVLVSQALLRVLLNYWLVSPVTGIRYRRTFLALDIAWSLSFALIRGASAFLRIVVGTLPGLLAATHLNRPIGGPLSGLDGDYQAYHAMLACRYLCLRFGDTCPPPDGLPGACCVPGVDELATSRGDAGVSANRVASLTTASSRAVVALNPLAAATATGAGKQEEAADGGGSCLVHHDGVAFEGGAVLTHPPLDDGYSLDMRVTV